MLTGYKLCFTRQNEDVGGIKCNKMYSFIHFKTFKSRIDTKE